MTKDYQALLPEDTVVFSGFFDYKPALIGVDVREDRAVYDYELMLKFLLDKCPEWDEEQAIEWLEYNTLGAHIQGEPIVIRRFEEYEADDEPVPEESAPEGKR